MFLNKASSVGVSRACNARPSYNAAFQISGTRPARPNLLCRFTSIWAETPEGTAPTKHMPVAKPVVLTMPKTSSAKSAEEWTAWMGKEMAKKLVGVSAETSRVQVRTIGVQSARVSKGDVRAEELDVVLELEGRHLKVAGCKATGVVRVVLKTEGHHDALDLSDLQWSPELQQGNPQVLADFEEAAEYSLESALACHLNDMLWDIERHSLDEDLLEETM